MEMLHLYRLVGFIEYCFNILVSETLTVEEVEKLAWLLGETFEPELLGHGSFLKAGSIVEIGPRMSFATAWNTNAVSICHACGLTKVVRIERSRRYADASKVVRDRMTEMTYPESLTTFETGITPEPVFEVPILEEGRVALEKLNREMGLGMDDWDINYYTDMFKELDRNPNQRRVLSARTV